MSVFRGLSVALTECAHETGYDYDMLVDRVEELVYGEHSFSWNDAVEYICELAYEGEL